MQIERRPNRWPLVGILIGLLIACLFATRSWQRSPADDHGLAGNGGPLRDVSPAWQRSAGSAPIGGPQSIAFGHGVADWSLDLRGYNSASVWSAGVPASAEGFAWGESGVLRTPSIDELVAAYSTSADLTAWSGVPASQRPLEFGKHGLGTWQPFPPMTGWNAMAYTSGQEVEAVPSPLITGALRYIGKIVAAYSQFNTGQMLGQAAGLSWAQITQPLLEIGPVLDAGTNPLPNFRLDDKPVPTPPVDIDPRVPLASGPFSVPRVLIEQLTRLAQDQTTRRWATETIVQLDGLTQLDRSHSEMAAARLSELRQLTDQALVMAEASGDDRIRVELLRAHWGLARRVDCWSAVNTIHIAAVGNARVATRGSLDALLADVPAREDVESLSAGLESYERTRDPQLARHLVASQQSLRESSSSFDVALADAVEQHYRNANVRVAITANMLNRFVAGQRNESRPVCDFIAGTPVRGQSETLSQSRVLLDPATGRWQLDIEATGTVDSNTVANGGRARLRSYGTTEFTAQKSVVVDQNGVQMGPAKAGTTNFNHLAGVTTDFDWVPLLSSFARSQAVQQYRAKRPIARAEVEDKVANQAMERLDREAQRTVERIERQVRERVTDQLARSGVELTPLELTTTQERLVARLRIAGAEQLAGHTPRPRAPSDSLASLQIHESALTNAAVSLGLDGQRFSGPELQAQLREKLPQLADNDAPTAREDPLFEFTYRDAVRFKIESGRLAIVLALDSVQLEGQNIRNFLVHAFYVPSVDGLQAGLVRDGSLGIEGRLSAGDRARLYNVFDSVFRPERRLTLISPSDASDERMADLMVTQLVLEDGWLGLAIGPQSNGRVAERHRSLR